MRKIATAFTIAALAAFGAAIAGPSAVAMPFAEHDYPAVMKDGDSNRWSRELPRGAGIDLRDALEPAPEQTAYPHPDDDGDNNRWSRELSENAGFQVRDGLRKTSLADAYPHPNDDGDADRLELGLVGDAGTANTAMAGEG